MTNRIIKRVFTHKSKLLLTLLCIFGLVFSYSCGCRNESTGPGTGGDGTGNGGNVTQDDGDKGQFAPTLSQSKSQLSLYANEDGTSKTNIIIEFREPNNYEIKNVVLKKVIGKSKDLFAGAEYHFTDKSYSFTISANSLKTVLDEMDTSQGPATDKLTLTFEITGNKDQVSNVTESVEVTVDLTKAQKIATDKAQSIMNEATKLDTYVVGGYNTAFTYDESNGSSASGNTTSIKNKKKENGEPSINTVASGLETELIGEYEKYFNGLDILDKVNGIGTKKAKIKIKFTPKIEYEFTEKDLTYYIELILDSSTQYNWIA